MNTNFIKFIALNCQHLAVLQSLSWSQMAYTVISQNAVPRYSLDGYMIPLLKSVYLLLMMSQFVGAQSVAPYDSEFECVCYHLFHHYCLRGAVQNAVLKGPKQSYSQQSPDPDTVIRIVLIFPYCFKILLYKLLLEKEYVIPSCQLLYDIQSSFQRTLHQTFCRLVCRE